MKNPNPLKSSAKQQRPLEPTSVSPQMAGSDSIDGEVSDDFIYVGETNKPPFQHLGTTLRGVRKQRGMSLKNAALSCGMAFSYLASFERGERRPSRDHLAKLARYYAISEQSLLEEAGYIDPREAMLPVWRLMWAKECIARDPDAANASELRQQLEELDLVGMAFVVEIYRRITGRSLLGTGERAAVVSWLGCDDLPDGSKQTLADFNSECVRIGEKHYDFKTDCEEFQGLKRFIDAMPPFFHEHFRAIASRSSRWSGVK